MKGYPAQIVFVSEEHNFQLNEPLLESILTSNRVKDKKVMVLSVAGAFRKGKSFLLDLFIRYLSHDNKSKWLDDKDQPLGGFSWRGGSERETTGILLWSEPFILCRPDGEKVAVFLMDTQGAFDSSSTVRDCATVFALSSMISSVMIYNLSQNIQEDDLHHLQLFTEYGRVAMDVSEVKPFQSLLFLIRDWAYPYEADYGYEGGLTILNRRLNISERQHRELQDVRKFIRGCFEHIQCLLMPHPGIKVASSLHFDGRIKDIEPEFVRILSDMTTKLLDVSNLVPKKVDGIEITCKELLQYFKVYLKVFEGDDMPHPMTMYEATAEANNLSAMHIGIDMYKQAMDNICDSSKPYINENDLAIAHDLSFHDALTAFSSRKKMGTEEMSCKYRSQLETNITEMYREYSKANSSKSLVNMFRTPLVFSILSFVFYVLSGVVSMVGLVSLANIFNLFTFVFFFFLALWVYIRLTGNYIEFSLHLDVIGNIIWNDLFRGYTFVVTALVSSQVTRNLASKHSSIVKKIPPD